MLASMPLVLHWVLAGNAGQISTECRQDREGGEDALVA